MVHLVPAKYDDVRRGDYWKSECHARMTKDAVRTKLREEYGCTVPSSSFKLTRLRYLLSRAERGMIMYEKFTPDELLSLCAKRGVRIVSTERIKPREIIALLEAEDEDDAKFYNFINLPPELRLEVYEHYFDSLRIRKTSVSEGIDSERIESSRMLPIPPLAQANCFATSRFPYSSTAFDLSSHLLHLLRRLRKVSIGGHVMLAGSVPVVDRWHIDLNKVKNTCSVTRVRTNENWYGRRPDEIEGEHSSRAMRTFAEAMEARVESGCDSICFNAEDVRALQHAFEAACRKMQL